MDLQALSVTLRLAAITTVILLVIAIPLAFWIVSTRSRLRAVVEAVTTLPILLPPTVLGFYLLVLLGQRTALGRLWVHLTGHTLAFTFTGLVIGSAIYSLPFAVQPMVAGFSSIDVVLIEQARLLGASRWRILRSVLLPLSARSVAAAALLCFTHTVGEFGVVLMVGGDIPGATRTLSIAIYDQVQGFAYADANRTALLLVGIAVTSLILLYARRGAYLSSDSGAR
ncbi:MAG: molybdate ABC transporter permease subunit [Acidobacteriaceae bacterium]